VSPTSGKSDRLLRLAAVGDNCVDIIATPGGREVRLVGGNAVNVAVQARRADMAAAYFGAVGKDAEGVLIRDALRREDVDVAGLVMRPGRTAVTRIGIAADGERSILHENFGTCRGYVPSPAEVERLAGFDHVHLGWIDDSGALRRTLAARGVSVSQDLSVNARPQDLGSDGLAVAFGSHGGEVEGAVALARSFLAGGARLAVVTRGADGAVIASADQVWRVAAEPVAALDTTGAGDAFAAGFLGAWLRGHPPDVAGRSGSSLARLACLHAGGFPQ
jgi:fructoselysine 6-kinase